MRFVRRPLLDSCLAVALLLTACGGGGSDNGDEPRGLGQGLDASDERAAVDVPPPVEVPADAPKVLVLGDSLGAGLHLAEHQAFPALLQRRLADEGRPFHLLNASVSGRTTSGGVSALDWTLAQEPDLVVIELGANDGLRGVAVEEIEANLRTMIERSRAAGAQVLLLGVRLYENFGDYGEEMLALYPRLAEEFETGFVPFFMEGVGGNPDLNLPDGLHPTPEGHERVADNVIDALRAALAELE